MRLWSTNEKSPACCWLKIEPLISMIRKWQSWRRPARCWEIPHYATEAQRERECAESHGSLSPALCVFPQEGPPSSLSVSVWMASTKRASPGSRRSSRLALVYSGPAGSRPARTDWCEGSLSSQPQEPSQIHCTPTLEALPVQNSPKRAQRWRISSRPPYLGTPILLSLTSQWPRFAGSKMSLITPTIW